MYRNRRIFLVGLLLKTSGNIHGHSRAMKSRIGPFFFVEFFEFEFFFLLFRFLVFNKRRCYVFIIPITDSDHLQQSYICCCRTACRELTCESVWGTPVHTVPECFFREHSLYFLLQYLFCFFSFLATLKTPNLNWSWWSQKSISECQCSVSLWITMKLLCISFISALVALISPHTDVCSPPV